MSSTLERELSELLAESREQASERERTAFDRDAGDLASRLVLFGAGNLGRKTLAGLRSAGIEPLLFADNDERLWGKRVEGVEVVSPEEAARRHGNDAAFVVTIWRGEGTDRMRERVRQLQELGCRRITDFLRLFWKLQGVYLPHYAVHLPHRVIDQRDRVMAAFALLADESSRSEYVGEVRWRLLGDFDRLGEPVSTEIYFPDDLYRTTAQEAFVDCGAFDGDTIRRVFARHPDFAGSIHAFEPDPRNFSKLSAWAASLPPDLGRRIVLHQNAVGRRRETLRFNATGTESASVGEGSTEVEAVALDEALAGWRPSYIKMDTEGSEEDALHGAAATIRESEPALAICVYHRQNHLWEIPLLVRSLSTRYAIHLRPQLLEGWDLVCYAVPR